MDVAIRYCPPERRTSDLDVVVEIDLLVAGARSLIGDAEISDPAQLVHLPWLQELGTNEVAGWFARHGVTLDRPLMISHMPGHLILDAVSRGEGVTYTARQWVWKALRSGALVDLFPDAAPGVFHMLTQQGVMRPPVQTFVTWLRAQAALGQR